jgi:hypothetical protein
MTIENREQLEALLISRVIENAPLREVIRVYSEAVKNALSQLDDDQLIESVKNAEYTDLLEAFQIEVEEKEPAVV